MVEVGGDFPVGVYFVKRTKLFAAQIRINGKKTGLGYYSTPEKAFQVYKKAKEFQVKTVVGQFKDSIDPRVFESLMNWEVDIKS